MKRFGSPRSETRWDGVLISAQEGTDIRAVSSGRVVFADWLRGYGLLIIIDHGNGYMTLYAFNQSLYKKVGEAVNMGTVIAAVGKSDGREESGLYFGIRNQGKPIDPLHWFR
jgi:septal ring factor EnvC (AmiA/AmiB activator)